MDSDTGKNMHAGDWSVVAEGEHYNPLGFLQMCIERRFHQAVQERFQKETGLKPTEYWIHTGVGGSPNMMGQHEAPDYCVREGATVMGWCGHGSKCGGLPGKGDDEIKELLMEALAEKVKRYRGLTHHAFFAIQGDKPGEVKIWHVMALPGPENE